jgi:DNA-binding MarR family transcriptional regulator
MTPYGGRIANELVDDGLAAFDDNPRHQRSPFLRLSPAGRGTLDAITERSRERNGALVRGRSGADVDALRAALRALTAAARAQLEADDLTSR